MMISSTEGFINQEERYSKDNAGTSKSKYTLLFYGELSYNHGNSKTKKYGSIFTLTKQAALIPFVYHSFKIINQNPFYFGRYLNLTMHDKYLVNIISSGARMDGLLNISAEDFFKMPIKYPSIEEQNYIEYFLNQIDKKILILKKKIHTLKKYKEGLIQKSKYSCCLISLKDLLYEENLKVQKNDMYPIISSTNEGLFLQRDYFKHQIASKSNVGYKILKKDRLVLSPQNLWLGNININDKYDIGCVSPSYKIFRINNRLIEPDFLINYLKSPGMLYKYKTCSEQGASIVRRNLNISLFLDLKINVPSKKFESIFKIIKQKNKLLEDERNQLHFIKNYLLSNLFI